MSVILDFEREKQSIDCVSMNSKTSEQMPVWACNWCNVNERDKDIRLNCGLTAKLRNIAKRFFGKVIFCNFALGN